MTDKNYLYLFLFLPVFLSGLALADIPPHITSTNLVTGQPLKLALKGAEKKGTVIAFLSHECPCSISHEKPLRELVEKYPEFQFYGIYADPVGTIAEGKKHYAEMNLPFPILLDKDKSLANGFEALRTPHIFVLDSAGNILYRGSVDNSRDAPRASQFFLADALAAIRNGQPAKPSVTKPLGCAIEH